MVWGAIGIDFIENDRKIFKSSNIFFQQDGARCHYKPEVLVLFLLNVIWFVDGHQIRLI